MLCVKINTKGGRNSERANNCSSNFLLLLVIRNSFKGSRDDNQKMKIFLTEIVENIGVLRIKTYEGKSNLDDSWNPEI